MDFHVFSHKIDKILLTSQTKAFLCIVTISDLTETTHDLVIRLCIDSTLPSAKISHSVLDVKQTQTRISNYSIVIEAVQKNNYAVCQ